MQAEEKEIMNRIEQDKEEMLRFLGTLVRANSENPPGNEKQVGLLIADKLREIGCRVEIQKVEEERFNVLGFIDGKEKGRLLFNGHMDTVKIGNPDEWKFDPLGGEIADGLMYGRGTTDMKAGLVSMIYAIKALVQSGIPFKKGLMFTAVIDEEVFFKGTQALLDEQKLDHCQMGFVSEPTGLQIATCLKGGIEFTARTYGKAAHSGMAYEGENAIYHMCKVVRALEDYNDQLKDRINLPGLKYPTVNVGKINGGLGVTFVPDFCEIEFDRQVLPGEDIQEVEKEIFDLIEEVGRKYQFKLELRKNQHFNTWRIKEDEAVVKLLDQACTDVLGMSPDISGLCGYCEVEMLASRGIPSVVFGPGEILTAHRPNECVKVQEVVDGAKVYGLLGYRFMKG
ncbi:M20 family metallopeptidase [Candidatus Formimonas warabiya]|uniref:Probable succinyl-diaminopimelate desuccinylase n=1 Tax=Formimonas warabiya TaxID=1761012 RepID=A0A3G1KWN8_FORW1|nr:M20 family metallopeptidase [Candidatus Formimonas warabiya]ATW26779.1 hypothetical protein DCMF_20205 [Candidatus Formimonas warabiya]